MSFVCKGSFNAFQLFNILDEAPEAWNEVASSMNFIHVGLEHVSTTAQQFVKDVSCTCC